MLMRYELYLDKLNNDYQDICKSVKQYAVKRGIGGKYLGERMMDIVDLFMEAQKQGVKSDDVIRSSIDDFCDSLFGDYSLKNQIMDFFHNLTFCSWIFFLIGLYYIGIYNCDISMTVELNWLWAVCACCGLLSIVEAVFLLIYPGVKNNRIINSIKMISQVITYFALTLLVVSNKIHVTYLFIISSTYLLMYYCIHLGYRFISTGSFKYKSNDCMVNLREYLKEEWNKEFICESKDDKFIEFAAKRYNKMNTKRSKKGKDILDSLGFCNYMQREYKLCINVMIGIIVLIDIIGTIILSLGYGIGEGIICLGAYTIMGGILILIFSRILKKGYDKFEELKELCVQNNSLLDNYESGSEQ